LHGHDKEGSDLDLLVDVLPGATLFDLGGLQVELESLLGIRVELLTPSDLPKKFRAQVLAEAHPQIPWRNMRGMRNRIAHGYFEINLKVVWDTVVTALPELLIKLQKVRTAHGCGALGQT
jgi:hypothetical protein